MENPNYYAIIPATVRYDNELRPNEKLLFGEITALTYKTGECYANNKYFSELYKVKPNAVATWLRHLKEKKYINVFYEYNGKEIKKRIITLGGIQKDMGVVSKKITGGIQKGEENNIKEIYNNKLLYIKKSFEKPTIEEIKCYCLERNNNVDPEQFYDYYESVNWLVGKNKKMSDWKASIRTWERKNRKSDPYATYTRV